MFRMTYDAPPSVRQAAGRLIRHLRFGASDKGSMSSPFPEQLMQSQVPESARTTNKPSESHECC